MLNGGNGGEYPFHVYHDVNIHATADPNLGGSLRNEEGDLEASMTKEPRTVHINSTKNLGITVRPVDFTNPYFKEAPKDALYEITTHTPERRNEKIINRTSIGTKSYIRRDGTIVSATYSR